MKLAIPLLNDKLTKADIDEKSGFINAFFEDINKPACCNHIFMMYDLHAGKENAYKTIMKVDRLDNKYSRRVAYINNKPYEICSFTVNKTIRNLRNGIVNLTLNQKKRILDFWGNSEPWVVNNILAGMTYSNPNEEVVPEEDYRPSLSEIRKGGTP